MEKKAKTKTEDTKYRQEYGAPIGNVNWYEHFGKLFSQSNY